LAISSTEAEAVWLHRGDGPRRGGACARLRFESGFGLVQALGDLDLRRCPLGSSAAAANRRSRVSVAPAAHAFRSQARSRPSRNSEGYWEYLLDEAIFTHPAHPNWAVPG